MICQREAGDGLLVNLGGIVPLSTVDWRGRAAMVVFLRGCPLRCPHCHNYALQTGESNIEFHALASRIVCRIKGLQTPAIAFRASTRQISLEDASVRAASRPFVDAFVLSGGEPLLQPEASLRLFGLAKSLSLATGLETSGFYPGRLRALLKSDVVDRVFLDLKTELNEPAYQMATGITGVADRVRESLEICYQSGVAIDARCTIFPELPSKDQIREIARTLEGLSRLYPDSHLESLTLQQGHPREGEPWFEPVALEEMQEMQEIAQAAGEGIAVQVGAPAVIKWAGQIAKSI
ncbi:MAG: radical SAM protein [Methanothrix sp.]|uniref:radical SAM protein n=1 Tax=Methanothrix sp. TaxID=90426 RepID=UPI0025FB123C|nr:radical SAM protein [Methanothrix sp.]MBK7386946.1 radical SAM protein [Methanothrix sp.]